eukprot:334756-Pelagomonas_calceolata.AAC.2
MGRYQAQPQNQKLHVTMPIEIGTWTSGSAPSFKVGKEHEAETNDRQHIWEPGQSVDDSVDGSPGSKMSRSMRAETQPACAGEKWEQCASTTSHTTCITAAAALPAESNSMSFWDA